MLVLSLILAAASTRTNHAREDFGQCLNAVIGTYFAEDSLLIVSPAGTAPPLEELAATGNKPRILFEDAKFEVGRVPKHGAYDVLLYNLSNVEALKNVFGNGARIVRGKIVITTETTSEDLAKQFISTVWNLTRVVDVAVLMSKNGSVEAYIWFPYGPGECTDVETIRIVDRWRNGSFEKKRNLFPEKVPDNLNGCDVFACTRPIEPYVFTPKVPGRYAEGYEVRILAEFAARFNASLRYVSLIDPKLFWVYDRSKKRESQGVLGLLLSHEVDVAFGGMMTRQDRYELIDGLYPHMIEHLIWVYPSPGPKNNFSTIYDAFSLELRFLIVSFHVFASLALFVACRASRRPEKSLDSDFPHCFFTCLAILFGAYATKPSGSALRFIVINYVIYALHLSAAYQSSLIVLLVHTQWNQPIRDVSELVDRNMTAHLFTSGKFMYNRSDHHIWDRILQPGHQKYVDGIEMDVVLHEIAVNRSSFLLFPRSCIEYLVAKFYSDEDKSLFAYLEYFAYPITIYVSPGNPLRGKLDDLANRLLESGVSQHWKTAIHRSQVYNGADKGNYGGDPSQDAEPLKLRHLEGIFLAWSILLSVAALVFIGEIVLGKILANIAANKKKRKALH